MNTENDSASVNPPFPHVALVLLPEEALSRRWPDYELASRAGCVGGLLSKPLLRVAWVHYTTTIPSNACTTKHITILLPPFTTKRFKHIILLLISLFLIPSFPGRVAMHLGVSS